MPAVRRCAAPTGTAAYTGSPVPALPAGPPPEGHAAAPAISQAPEVLLLEGCLHSAGVRVLGGEVLLRKRFAAAFGSEEARKMMEKRFRISVCRIPDSLDVFAVTHADMSFFAELLRD